MDILWDMLVLVDSSSALTVKGRKVERANANAFTGSRL